MPANGEKASTEAYSRKCFPIALAPSAEASSWLVLYKPVRQIWHNVVVSTSVTLASSELDALGQDTGEDVGRQLLHLRVQVLESSVLLLVQGGQSRGQLLVNFLHIPQSRLW